MGMGGCGSRGEGRFIEIAKLGHYRLVIYVFVLVRVRPDLKRDLYSTSASFNKRRPRLFKKLAKDLTINLWIPIFPYRMPCLVLIC